MHDSTIGFIGSGNMARSLISGLIAAGFFPKNIWASDPQLEKTKELEKQFKINTSTNNHDIVKHADVLIFAIKPQMFKEVALDIAPIIKTKNPLVISIAAGIPICSIKKWLGGNIPIVRTMPNTPALIQCGATALVANETVSNNQKSLAESIMRAVGITVWVEKESLLDAVTALSGSGPAYFFLMMEALSQSAIKLGLEKETALLLTLQTALGSAKMALESEESLEELRRRVTSPGGTTEAALNTLQTGKLVELLESAVKAATNRSHELAKMFD